MAKLVRLHAAVGRMAEDAPEIIASPTTAHGLEQSLIEAMVNCLGAANGHENRAAGRRHELIMRRFHQVVEEAAGMPLYIPEVCAAIRVLTAHYCCAARSTSEWDQSVTSCCAD